MSKVKRWWQNGNKVWVWYLIGLAAITFISKASGFVTDSRRYEPRIQKLEDYRENDIKNTTEWRTAIKKDIEHIKDGIDEIKENIK